MAKYDPLSERLRGSRARTVRLTFSEIEDLLGAGLPKGARQKRGWWANEDSGHAAAWVGAGYAADVDLDDETVTYRRSDDDEGRFGHARDLFGATAGQARDVLASRAGQVRDLWDDTNPTLRRVAPWVLLGVAVLAVVGVVVQRALAEQE